MALECQEDLDSSLKNISFNSWEEEIFPADKQECIPYFVAKANFNRKFDTKLAVVQKPNSSFALKKVVANSGSTYTESTDGSGSNEPSGQRSITDLPEALVSEIFHCLDAKELGIVSCVSNQLYKIATNHQGWKNFYCERWGLPLGFLPATSIDSSGQKTWKELFLEREYRSKSFMGRFSIDVLHGHTEAVRSVFLFAPAKLIFSGGYDSVIRMWDMEEGFCIAVSRPLGCTIRAIVSDMDLLVTGGTDAFLQCWRAVKGHPHIFDIAGTAATPNSDIRLWGHEGPVTCLALDSTRIYSGSWDMSIRIWDRDRMKSLRTLRHRDWVWCLSPRGTTLASTAGRDVYVWDTATGDLEVVMSNAHVGNAHALTRSHIGDLLFTGGEDGSIHMFEIGSNCNDNDIKPAATWIPHTGPVHSLAFEYPWVVSSSSDGKLALIDVRKLLRCRRSLSMDRSNLSVDFVEPPQRMLHGFGSNLFSVDIGADRIVCGGEEGVVRVWNFSQALEIEKRTQALRSARQENRMRRRKAQVEMNTNGGRSDQCSVVAKRNQMNGDRTGVWHNKRGVAGKLRA